MYINDGGRHLLLCRYYAVTRACPLFEASFWDMGREMGISVFPKSFVCQPKSHSKKSSEFFQLTLFLNALLRSL